MRVEAESKEPAIEFPTEKIADLPDLAAQTLAMSSLFVNFRLPLHIRNDSIRFYRLYVLVSLYIEIIKRPLL